MVDKKASTMRFGIIGFGGAGRAHYRRLVGLDGVEVSAVYDPHPPSDIAELTSAALITDDLGELLRLPLDAVSICSPDCAHFGHARECIEHGFATLVEKPMLVSEGECEALADSLARNPVLFGVHHQMRYVPAFRAAYEAVRAGRLGEIVAVQSDYIHDMRERAMRFGSWRMERSQAQDLVLGGLSHTLDLMRWIVGESPHSVDCFVSNKGWHEYPGNVTVSATVRFSSGTLGSTTKTITSPGPVRCSLIVYGTDGQIHNNVFRDASGHVELLVEPPRKKKRQTIRGTAIRWGLRRDPTIIDYPWSIYEHGVACEALLRDFVQAVRSGTDFSVGFDEGRATVGLCLRCIEAYKRKRRA